MNSLPSGLPRQEVSLFDVVGLVLRWWRLLVVLPVLVTALAATAILLRPRSFVSSASFLPAVGDAESSRVANLASQFGVNLAGGRAGPSSAFYASVVLSRPILVPVVSDSFSYSVLDDTVRGTLVDLLGPERGSFADRREVTIERLRDNLSVTTNLETGIVRLSVTSKHPDLSQDVAQRLVAQLEAFDLRRRRAQAAAERVFLEERLQELADQLREAEEQQETFLRGNRDIRNSPELLLRNERLTREVVVRQQIYTSFAQAYEEARIDESRNTPALAVIERPEAPVRPRSRGVALKSCVTFVVTALVMLGVAGTVEFVRRQQAADPAGADAVRSLGVAMLADLRRLGLRHRSG